MSFTASVQRTIRLGRSEAFERFIDFRNWQAFMPKAFQPVRGPERALKPGDRLRMKLDTGALRLPVTVDVFRLDPPNEIVWGGGNRLLHAWHQFRFEDAGDGSVIVHSDEEWTGVLADLGPVARRLKHQAERVGKAQLSGFARWVEG